MSCSCDVLEARTADSCSAAKNACMACKRTNSLFCKASSMDKEIGALRLSNNSDGTRGDLPKAPM
eukprot:5216241-Amphidinium_carterae.2